MLRFSQFEKNQSLWVKQHDKLLNDCLFSQLVNFGFSTHKESTIMIIQGMTQIIIQWYKW